MLNLRPSGCMISISELIERKHHLSLYCSFNIDSGGAFCSFRGVAKGLPVGQPNTCKMPFKRGVAGPGTGQQASLQNPQARKLPTQ